MFASPSFGSVHDGDDAAVLLLACAADDSSCSDMDDITRSVLSAAASPGASGSTTTTAADVAAAAAAPCAGLQHCARLAAAARALGVGACDVLGAFAAIGANVLQTTADHLRAQPGSTHLLRVGLVAVRSVLQCALYVRARPGATLATLRADCLARAPDAPLLLWEPRQAGAHGAASTWLVHVLDVVAFQNVALAVHARRATASSVMRRLRTWFSNLGRSGPTECVDSRAADMRFTPAIAADVSDAIVACLEAALAAVLRDRVDVGDAALRAIATLWPHCVPRSASASAAAPVLHRTRAPAAGKAPRARSGSAARARRPSPQQLAKVADHHDAAAAEAPLALPQPQAAFGPSASTLAPIAQAIGMGARGQAASPLVVLPPPPPFDLLSDLQLEPYAISDGFSVPGTPAENCFFTI